MLTPAASIACALVNEHYGIDINAMSCKSTKFNAVGEIVAYDTTPVAGFVRGLSEVIAYYMPVGGIENPVVISSVAMLSCASAGGVVVATQLLAKKKKAAAARALPAQRQAPPAPPSSDVTTDAAAA